MTITATLDVRDEILIRLALARMVQSCKKDKEEAEKRKDVVAAYQAEHVAETFRRIESMLHDLEMKELERVKKGE